jgi:secreted PhoX family phosphatase
MTENTMTQQFSASRRKALKIAGGVPLLPFGAALASSTSLLAACSSGGESAAMPASAAMPISVKFNSMAAPTATADRAAVFTNATFDVSYSDGSSRKAQPLSFKEIYRTGQSMTAPDGRSFIAGGYYLPDGVTPIVDLTGASAEHMYSDCPDGTSLIRLSNPAVSGIAGNTLFLVTQFEYKTADNAGNSLYGVLPSPIGIATLDQDKTSGALKAKHYYNVPTESVHGLWITCAGSISPWNTHLSSEEYEPDAWTAATNTQFKTFSYNTFGSETAANPYHYGHVPEVTVHPDGTGSIRKHYCMGRISRELVQVMPDQRTVLMGDDATSGGMFMFVADVAKNLSSGSLYAAKVVQTSASGAADGGSFTISWIKLGRASSIEIESMAAMYKAADIIDVKTTDPADASYTKINFGNGQQWVKVLPGMEKAAAFLETRRYAAIMGATMEFTKFEGVTVNAKDKIAYIAISSIRDTMTANGFVSDAIQLKKISAGATYAITLGDDAVSGSSWVPKSMAVPAGLLGEDISKDADGNTAAVDKVANPDNLKYSEAMRTLFIGEDSGQHLNNYVWAYNVDSGSLSRILSVPAGAECVCLTPVDDANGFAYVLSGFQHPGDWSFTETQADLDAAVKTNWGNKKQAAVGYLSGLPTIG